MAIVLLLRLAILAVKRHEDQTGLWPLEDIEKRITYLKCQDILV